MKSYFLLVSFIATLLITLPASATSLLPISLQQLSTRANLIIYATVLSNQVSKDDVSGHIATFTKLDVIETIKGSSEKKHTIKQLGGSMPGSRSRLNVQGVPKYVIGNNYVIFLPEESSLGFCSPLGLHQGSFAVTTINDEPIVSNGHKFAQQSSRIVSRSSVQVPLAAKADNPGQASLFDFVNTVRAYNTP